MHVSNILAKFGVGSRGEAAATAHRLRLFDSNGSLQEYLRAELTRNARTRTPAELVAETEQRLSSEGGEGFATRSSAVVLRADRAAH